MYPRLRPPQRGQTKPFGHRCAVRCSPHRTSSPKRERNSLTVMMDFRFNRLGFFMSDILSPFVRLFKLDIHQNVLPIWHICSFCWLKSLRLMLLRRLGKPKLLSVIGPLTMVGEPRPPIRPVTATPPPWSMTSAGSREKSAMPFLRMRHVGSTSTFPRLTSAAPRQSRSRFGRSGPTRQAGDMPCLKPPRITPIPLRVSASFRTMPPATAFRPPCAATSDMWRTATANPLLEYGTTSRLFLIRARQEGTK